MAGIQDSLEGRRRTQHRLTNGEAAVVLGLRRQVEEQAKTIRRLRGETGGGRTGEEAEIKQMQVRS